MEPIANTLQTKISYSNANTAYEELIKLLIRFGFNERIKGSHHIFYKEDIAEILNLQSKSGKAKPYQVKQIREIIVKYNLSLKNHE